MSRRIVSCAFIFTVIIASAIISNLSHYEAKKDPNVTAAAINNRISLKETARPISVSAEVVHGDASAFSPDKSTVISKINKLHVPFIANQGQAGENVKFYARTFGGNVYVTGEGEIVYRMQKSEGSIQNSEEGQGITIKEQLIGSKISEINGEGAAKTKISYFRGNDPSKWLSDIPTYDFVNLGEVYDGIELKLKAYGNNIEKLFYVKPGAESANIQIRLDGAKGLSVNEDGELVVETEREEVRFTKPVAYQEIGGERTEVAVQYVVAYTQSLITNDELIYSFRVGSYDKSKELVVDPLLASTYLGGRGLDVIHSIAVDLSGDVYVAGMTSSPDFPTAAGAYDAAKSTLQDIFISKFSGDLTKLSATSFIGGGGPGAESIKMAISPDGSLYFAGMTWSKDFPVTQDAYETTFKTNQIYTAPNIFISRLNSDLSDLLSSTFFGGNYWDIVNSLILDASGNVYIAGSTSSSDFPTTAGAFDTTIESGKEVAFISKFNSTLNQLLASTFVGEGNAYNIVGINSIAAADNGEIYVTGSTASSSFPTTKGAYSTTFNGGYSDVFVSKFSNDLTKLLASTFLGGKISGSGMYSTSSGYEHASAIAIDQGGNVYITGWTQSPNFPTTGDAFSTAFTQGNSVSSIKDIFVSKLNSDLNILIASTFLGGSGDDTAGNLVLDKNNNIIISGITASTDFPVISGPGDIFAGYKPFLTKLNGDLGLLLASTLIEKGAFINSIALDKDGNVYAAGITTSYDFPVTPGAYDVTSNNNPICINSYNPSSQENLKLTVYYGLGSNCGVEVSSSHTINGNNIHIDISKTSLKHDGEIMCPAIIMPLSVTEQIGKLTPGEYKVSVNINDNFFASRIFEVIDSPSVSEASCDTYVGGFSFGDAFISKFDQRFSDEKGGMDIWVLPNDVDFDSVGLGNSSTRDIKITNISDKTQVVNSISITGTDSEEFSQTSSCASLTAASACKMSVSFSPKTAGAKSAKMILSFEGIDSPIEVSLSGTGQKQYTLTILNSGTGSGTVSGSGFDCDGYPCTQTFAEGTSVKVMVHVDKDSKFEKFEGACTGRSRCNIKMDADKTVTAVFSRPDPAISVPSSLNFGKAKVNTISGKKIISIKNKGKGTLTLTDVSIDSKEIYLANWSGQKTIAPNKSLNLALFLVPTFEGQKQSKLTITSNDPKTPNKEIVIRGSATGSPVSNDFAGRYTGTYSSVDTGISEGTLSFIVSASGKVVALLNGTLIGTGNVKETGEIKISSIKFAGTISYKDGEMVGSGGWSSCPICRPVACGASCQVFTWTAQKD